MSTAIEYIADCMRFFEFLCLSDYRLLLFGPGFVPGLFYLLSERKVVTMKNVFLLLLILIVAVPSFASSLESDQEKLSYAIGMSIGASFLVQGLELDLKTLSDGITAAYKKTDTSLTEEEMAQVLGDYQKQSQQKQEAKAAAVVEENRIAGKAYLAENAMKDGVKTTESGLQYEVLEEGTGAIPTAEDQVTVNYRGILIDGTEFDSSYKRDEPATFPVGGVIAGWTEALQLMKEGTKLKLTIPPELAYGDRGAGPTIGPGSTLVFEVELVKIVKN
jgi:FKBP-type peptidyl-prolyl cis-trans isomerase FklB